MSQVSRRRTICGLNLQRSPLSNALVSVKLRIGDIPSTAKPVRRSQDQILRFLIHDGDQERPVIGRDGADPAGLLRPPSSGLQVIGYQSTPAFIELQADTFASYLAEKGLDHVRDFRTQWGETHKNGTERYTRCLKSLIAVGPQGTQGNDQRLGFPLELIAEDNPYQRQAGTDFSLQLLFKGKPLAGALVKATLLQDPNHAPSPLTVRTNEAGRATFHLTSSGTWLMTVVHMLRATTQVGNTGSEADWESFWASITFALPS